MKTHFTPLTLAILVLAPVAAIHAQSAPQLPPPPAPPKIINVTPPGTTGGSKQAPPPKEQGDYLYIERAPGSQGATQLGGAVRVRSATGDSDTLILMRGPLPEVVRQVEVMVPKLRGSSGEPAKMPSIIYGKGTKDQIIGADLRIRQVTPVQALSLVSVAAGCTLEPIHSTREQQGSPEVKIIGYAFRLQSPRTTAPGFAPQVVPNPILTEPVPLHSAVTKLRSAPTAIPSAEARAEARTKSNTAIGAENPYSIGGHRRNETQGTDPSKGNFTQRNAPTHFGGFAPTPVIADTPTVHIYALGAVVYGGPGEEKEKHRILQQLVEAALTQAKLGAKDPALSYHESAKALIVKGTAAQHDIIRQILAVMKENQKAESANR